MANSEDKVTVDRTDLQTVLDCAIGSMDFSSGMFVDEDVKALRALAILLGLDPMVATPANFKCAYDASCHSFAGYTNSSWHKDMCLNCHRVIDRSTLPSAPPRDGGGT